MSNEKGVNGFYGMEEVKEQIRQYIAGLPDTKRSDIETLHRFMQEAIPGCKLWFLDGKDSEGKTIANPNIGYGDYTISYADGSTKAFYRIGLSANKTGISVYIFGIADKTYLSQTYGAIIGKASVTGYCIRFKTLKDLNSDVLKTAIRSGIELRNEKGDV